jgi:ribosome-binding factor A
MAKPAGVRPLQVGRQVLESLSRYIGSCCVWDVPGYITLTRVKMSQDLKVAKVGVRLVSVNQEHPDQEPPHVLAVEALKASAYELQSYLAKDLKLRFTPKLHFVVDESWTEMLKVENTLRQLELLSQDSKKGQGDLSSDDSKKVCQDSSSQDSKKDPSH